MHFIDLIYPKRCVCCKREGQYICNDCQNLIAVRGGSLRYMGVVRQVIKEIKYRGSSDMTRELVKLWSEKTHTQYDQNKSLIVTAVPMSGRKIKIRGFNQAELIAREIARVNGLVYMELLERVRNTAPMYQLSGEERRGNVLGAFKTCSSVIPKKVLLIDDVITTGATINECRRVLLDAGVSQVLVVSIAR